MSVMTTQTAAALPEQPASSVRSGPSASPIVGIVGVDNLSLVFALHLIGIIAWSVALGLPGRAEFLTLAEPDEQPRPEHRHRGPAGHRRDRRHRGRRARHLGRVHRLAWPRSSVGHRHRPMASSAISPGARLDAGRHPGGHRSPASACGIVNGLDRDRAQREPHHRHAGHAGRVRRPRLPHGARRQAGRRGDPARLHVAGHRPLLRRCALAGAGRSAWTGVPILFLVLIIVAVLVSTSSCATPTSAGRSTPSAATPWRRAWRASTCAALRISMYMLCGRHAGLAGVLLTARTTSGNPINGGGFELQAITAVFLGGAATTGGKGTIVGTVLAVHAGGCPQQRHEPAGRRHRSTSAWRSACCSSARSRCPQWRQSRAERSRTRTRPRADRGHPMRPRLVASTRVDARPDPVGRG